MKFGFVISTFIALVLITIVTVYAYPLGLRGILNEGFATQGTQGTQNETVMNLKRARANMAEGFQGTTVTPTTIPPARPQGITTTTMRAGQNTPTVPTSNMNMNMPPVPMPTTPMPVPMPTTTPPPPVVPPPNAAMMAGGMPGGMPGMDMSGVMVQGFQNMNVAENQGSKYRKEMREGFSTNYAEVSAGAKDQYQAMGAFDGITLPTGNNVSSWRYTSPDEPLLGAPFQVGDNELFIFKNNQCKPECCGSSFSCSGGCVCTTPDQRDYINGRGGNRTAPADD
jgi:hypothetical protein